MITSIAIDFVSGCFGGAFGICVGHPFDTIKTVQQRLNMGVVKSCVEIVVRYDGSLVRGFYRGMSFPLVSYGAINSVVFSVYGYHLRQLESMCQPEDRYKWRQKHVFLAGMVAGFVQSYLVCPVEVIKTQMQSHRISGSGIRYAKTIFIREGLNGFYRGITPTLARDVGPYGIYMLTYDFLLDAAAKLALFNKNDSVFHKSNSSLIAFAGSIAGLISWIFVVPFDVVKTRMQAEKDPRIHPTMLKCGVDIYKAEGVRALFRGAKMLLLRSIPVNAVTFIGFEYCEEFLKRTSNIKPQYS